MKFYSYFSIYRAWFRAWSWEWGIIHGYSIWWWNRETRQSDIHVIYVIPDTIFYFISTRFRPFVTHFVSNIFYYETPLVWDMHISDLCHSSEWHMRYIRSHIWVIHCFNTWYIYIYLYVFIYIYKYIATAIGCRTWLMISLSYTNRPQIFQCEIFSTPTGRLIMPSVTMYPVPEKLVGNPITITQCSCMGWSTPIFYRQQLKIHFPGRKLYFDANFTKDCTYESRW